MKKNYYPMAIFGFLALMVCCIVVSVVIALKDPVLEDTSYFSQKKFVDSQINEIIKKHNAFLEQCQLYLNTRPSFKIQEDQKVYPPYLFAPNHPVLKISSPSFFLYLFPYCNKAKDLNIDLFLEKINSAQERIKIGKMQRHHNVFMSNQIQNLQEGRYKAIFEIHDLDEKLFFEKEIFITH